MAAPPTSLGERLRALLEGAVATVRDRFTPRTPYVHRPVNLPTDELQHEGLVEWWYFHAHLVAQLASGPRRLSLVATLLKRDVLGLPAIVGIARLTDHVRGPAPVIVHPARAADVYGDDRAANDFRFTLPARRCPIFGARTSWSVATDQVGFTPVYRLQMQGQHTLDLTLGEQGPPVRLGDQGVVTYPDGAELAYYFKPHLDVSGTMIVDGVQAPVTGTAWLERQWGEVDYDAYRWSYFPVQLDSGDRYLFYDVTHRRSGARSTFGLHVDASHAEHALTQVVIRASGRTQRHCLKRFAVDHRVTFVRADGTSGAFRFESIAADQVIVTHLPGVPVFFEGPSRVMDDAGTQLGFAMTEVV